MEKRNDEVRLTQHLRPHGHTRLMLAPVGEPHAKKAQSLVLSCETLPNGMVALYGRRKGQPVTEEIVMLAENGPGKDTPTEVLRLLIDQLVPGAGE